MSESSDLPYFDTYKTLAADILTGYLSNNPVDAERLPDLIRAVVSALASPKIVAPVELVPAVSPRKSVFPEYIISLETGRKFKSLTRHLSMNNMTADQYRAKWGLPRDYPMVAPAYSDRRKAIARQIGLGTSKQKSKTVETQAAQVEAAPVPDIAQEPTHITRLPEVKRGRRPKAKANPTT